uniref:right-handed parallel beta-helix repeat-containing protein n=1 Tax=Phenylobacterium sp. TaxID=1871053 RepID=UPI0025F8379A
MAIINVSSTALLTSALKAAVAGDTINLASGAYSGLNIGNLSYGSGITITSADASQPAIITDFTLTNMKGMTFSHVEMATLDHPDLIASESSFFAFKVSKGSSDITFDHVNFHGSVDGNAANDVMGLQIRDSSNISVTNSEFHDLERAMAVGTTDNVKITGNNVHDLRSDGFDLAAVGNVTIAGNTFRNFTPNAGDHPDAIQFWTSGTITASHDITISGNVITRGTGEYTQGIFLRDQIGTLHYEKVTISDNLIVGTGYSGIRVQGANGITISKNELVSFDGDNKTYM